MAGGAVAAAVSAVAASFLGVAGTVVGAAVGSVIYTLAATIFSTSVDRAAKVSRTLVIRRAVVPEGSGGAAPASAAPDAEPGEEPGGVPDEKVVEYTTRSGRPPEPSGSTLDSVWSRIRWKPLAIVAGLVFVAAMAVITVTELALGHPLGNSQESGITIVPGSQTRVSRSPASTPGAGPSATLTGSVVPTPTSSLGASSSASPSGIQTTGPTGTPSSPGLQTTAPGGGATTSTSSGPAQASPSR